jgi:PST family polysaccharide transporter
MSLSENEKTISFALEGFSWNTAGNFARSFAGFAINIVLARLLGPEPFGVVALALLIIGIGNLVIESGLGSALVQRKEIDRQDIAFVFTLQMAFSIGLAVIFAVLSPWLAEQFAAPTATPVLQVMALILVLQAFAQVPSALLRRKLDFKHLQIAQITSFFIGYLGFGFPLAFAGFGVWSLVAAQIMQSGLNALMVFLSSRFSPAFSLKRARHLTRFGLQILAANIANWIIQNVDQAVVGQRFGVKNLGFYSRAYFLNWTPTGIILTSAQASIFSAVSRMGGGTDTIRIFRGFMSAFAIFFFPIYWLIAMESTSIIRIIYGHEWMPAAALLKPLAVAMPFLALVGLEGPVLNGLGKPQYEMQAQWVTAFLAILVLTIAAQFSIQATAWSIVIIYIFRLFILSVMTTKVLEISWMQLMRPILSGLFMGILTVAVWNLSNYFFTVKITDILLSFARSMVVIFTWMLVFWIGHAWLFPEFSTLVNLIKRDKVEY